MRLTGFLERLLSERFGSTVSVLTPRDPARRGAQLSLVLPADVSLISERLTKRGVICDVRRPNVLRVAPAPLYNSFLDVALFVSILAEELDRLK